MKFNLIKFFRGLTDAGKITNVVLAVRAETKGITDPIELTQAVLKSAIKHSSELPAKMCGENLPNTVTEVATAILDLPIDEVRRLVRGMMG